MSDDPTPTRSTRDERAERALRDALASHADDVDPQPLTVPRRRRRWVVPVAAAGIVVLVAALGVAAGRHHDPSSAPAPSASDTATSSPTSRAVRTVGLGPVLVDVPASWGHGPDPDPGGWCAPDPPASPSTPYVSDPNRSSLGLPCPLAAIVPDGFPQVPMRLWVPHLELTRLSGSSSSVADDTQRYQGWTLTRRTVDDVVVSLLTDASTASVIPDVMGSIRTDGHP